MKKKTAVVFSGAMLLSASGLSACTGQNDAINARPTAPAVESGELATPSPVASATAVFSPFFSESPVSENGSAASGFSDGSYEAVGEYQSPAGSEAVSVNLTIEQGLITAVTVTPQAENEVSRKLQGQLAEGIGQLVVGKPLADVEAFAVVNGSSLSPLGFQQAVESIREQAAQNEA